MPHYPPQGPPSSSGGPNTHPPQTSGQIHVQTQGHSTSSRTSTGNFGSPAAFSPPSGGPTFSPAGPQSPAQPPFSQPHNRSFSQGNMQQQFSQPAPPYTSATASAGAPPYSSASASAAPPQLGALSFQDPQPPHQPPPQQYQPSHERQASVPLGLMAGKAGTPPQYNQPSAPPKPMFGVHLSRLYERDSLAVPSVVYQCIQAVDLFGLGVEGIYRQSGSLTHINKLKHMFDTGKNSARPVSLKLIDIS